MNVLPINVALWLMDHEFSSDESVTGKCVEVCNAIVKDLPEYTIQTGLVLVERGGLPGAPPRKADHCWLIDSNGKIVDPTARQYPTRILGYEPVPEGKTPIGKCMMCGSLCYVEKYFCSEACREGCKL